jgi:glucose-1-phosphate adenylyltransferase
MLSKELFLKLVENCSKENKFNLLEDGIKPDLDRLKVCEVDFNGYIGVINSLQDYYHHSMELLNPHVANELFDKGFPFYTKAKSDPPAKYGAGSEVKNTFVANGCVIEGKVENSILFWGVKVGPRAHIKNSILLPNCSVGADAKLENIILDKEMQIPEAKILFGEGFQFITK